MQMERDISHVPTGRGDEVEIHGLAPHLHMTRFPTQQIIGYLVSLLLTLFAFALVAYHWLPLNLLVIVVVCLAFVQGAIQLGIYMHLREGRGTLWHLPVLGLAGFVGLGIVGFSIWIMLFKSGVS
ncbi:MAG: cytochrome C oxidase subunit IV [Sulfobacillus acidophilus]|uniref:Cytochrome C oxidase subunit IV n=1 Tax=Sulfobacillus acidophilus TaxID=53633 RepID=A0A2T2WED5_9FIRM|nr:MAG: cytochrome C oxidase subunit IV [Sulfobacillus acidophilus]